MKQHVRSAAVNGVHVIGNYLSRFNPFYRPDDCWKNKKHIVLNYFKGYECFDIHYWSPRKIVFLDGEERNSKTLTMIGLTIFYLRIELFLEWSHYGKCWKRY